MYNQIIENKRETVRIEREIRHLKDEVSAYENRLKSLKEHMSNDTRSITEKYEGIIKDIENIKKFPYIEDVKLRDNKIEIHTHNIWINGKIRVGTTIDNEGIEVPDYEVKGVNAGKVMFTIDFNDKSISVFNKTLETHMYALPHVGSGDDGKEICFGEQQDAVSTELDNNNLYGLTKILIYWALNYNPEDQYRELEYYYRIIKQTEEDDKDAASVNQ